MYLEALFLGVLEGVTEFLPVSSTGHLILAGYLLGFEGPPGKVFEVVIQLGAILAILVVYFQRLWGVLVGLPTQPAARRFAAAILLAFLPSAVLGVLLHGFIKTVLFSPWVVSVALMVGGVVFIAVDRRLPPPTHTDIGAFSWVLALRIGLFQTLALVPGVSRSGATILGALLMGVDRKTAAEFSFFLAIPTMLGAATYDLFKNRHTLQVDDAGLIAVGFAAAFVAALVVVRTVVGFVSRHGFAPFGWYRLAVGALMLGYLLVADVAFMP
jgi:undecaprenyl-diphosphatase